MKVNDSITLSADTVTRVLIDAVEATHRFTANAATIGPDGAVTLYFDPARVPTRKPSLWRRIQLRLLAGRLA